MKKNTGTLILAITAIGALPAWAAVSLEITKPPVVGGINAGPLNDPDAIQGQWFENAGVRPNEFYDNVPGDGGGWAAAGAIHGHAINVVYVGGPGTPIMAFDIAATVTNDLGIVTDPWADGVNSHNEFLRTPEHYIGDMIGTMLTAEFALADLGLQPANWTPPYTQRLPEIVAMNEDDRGWYCYNQMVEPQNQGDFYVPAWDFGTIPIGQSASKILSFTVNGGLLPGDPRYQAIQESEAGQLDLLSNRTTSLKISNWVDDLRLDPGGPYDPETDLHSDASVFHHIPEPQSAALGLLGLGLLCLRRRKSAH